MKDKELEAVFSKNLKRLMISKDINQKDLCKELGIPISTLNGWYLGKFMPRANICQKIADFFNVELSDLIEEKDPQAEPEGLSLEQRQLINLVESMTPAEVKTCRAIVEQVLALRKDQ